MRRAILLLLVTLLPLACVLDLDRLQLSPDAAVPGPDGGTATDAAVGAPDSSSAGLDAATVAPDAAALPDAGPGVWRQISLGLGSAKVLDVHPGWDSKPVAWVLAEKSGDTYVGCCPNGECVWAQFAGKARALVRGLVGSDALVVGDDSAIQRCVFDEASTGRVTCEPLAFASDAGLGSLRVASRSGDEVLALAEDKSVFQLLQVFDGGFVAQRSSSGPASPRAGRGPTGEHWVLDAAGNLHKCLAAKATCASAGISAVTGLVVVSSPAGEQVLIAQGNKLQWKPRTAAANAGTWKELPLTSLLDDIASVGGQDVGALFVSGTRVGSARVLAVQLQLGTDGTLLSWKAQEDVAPAALQGIEVHNCPWGFAPDALYLRMVYADCCLSSIDRCF